MQVVHRQSPSFHLKHRAAARPVWLCGLAALLLAGCNSSDTPDHDSLSLQVVSSAPNHVSGGDTRVRVTADPMLHADLDLWLNGTRLTAPLKADGRQLEGVVSGFVDGSNTLEVRHRGTGARQVLQVTSHPITGPMFSGPQQTPFVCTTVQGAVGRKPLVDSASAPGYKVTDSSGQVIGYSRNCSIDTFVAYHYRTTSGSVNWPCVRARMRVAWASYWPIIR